jgi:hypothetical protein
MDLQCITWQLCETFNTWPILTLQHSTACYAFLSQSSSRLTEHSLSVLSQQTTHWLCPKLPYDRRSVGQSILVSGHHPGYVTNFSFTSPEYIFRHLRFSCGAPSLMTGWVCNLLVRVLLDLASAVTLGSSKCHRTWDHILLSPLRLGSLSVASYDSQRLR